MTVLDDYLILHAQGPHNNVWSCFAAALRDARKTTGRNEDTGQIVDADAQGNWLGAIGYLCLFDQLGTTVRLAAPDAALTARIGSLPVQPGQAEAVFRTALYQFSDVSDRDSATLWALRNSLAHNYSLINLRPNSNRADLRHRFALGRGGNALATYPNQAWDGHFPGTGGQTVVSVTRLAEVGETITARVLHEHGQGAVASDLPEGELRARYFFAQV